MANYNKLELLSNEPLDFHGLKIYKLTLRDISEIGLDNYNRLTSRLTMSILDIAKFFEQQKIGGAVPSPLSFLISSARSDPTNFLETYIAFSTYLRKSIEISDDEIIVKEGLGDKDFILNEQNFNEFQEAILMINKMYDVEEEREINSPNEALKQKFIKARLKLREAKRRQREKDSQKGDGITLPDIVSALCSYGIGYTMFNVWDLTIYQLYEQFERIQAKEEYEHNYSALLAGADSKKIKLKNWMK